jgi:hypothetical protein
VAAVVIGSALGVVFVFSLIFEKQFFMLFLAVFIGLLHGVTQLVVRSETELPFGPSLCLAAAVVVVWWRPLWHQTAVFFERPEELALVVGAVIVLTAVTLWIWHRIRPISAA